MDLPKELIEALEKCRFKVSTDTRKGVEGTLFFALKGENFNGNKFVKKALEDGAVGAVSDDEENAGDQVFIVEDVLKTLQKAASVYRRTFNIPIIAIGGSNGKTTSKELVAEVLKKKFKVHASKENLNNHIGVPLSILSMDPDTEAGIFEIGVNHEKEHKELLDIISPTMVAVTNNGLDHLEGFGSPEGVRRANKEIYDWAREHNVLAFVNKNFPDLMDDSKDLEKVLYPKIVRSFEDYKTQLVGSYNLPNIELALAVGALFQIKESDVLEAISKYKPALKRSQLLEKDGVKSVIDCYNANPTSMHLALESFFNSAEIPRGVVLGDMLELGKYSEAEHTKVVEYIEKIKPDVAVFIGSEFKKALEKTEAKYQWFPSSDQAQEWFKTQDWKGYTLILKGSRGLEVEKVLGL